MVFGQPKKIKPIEVTPRHVRIAKMMKFLSRIKKRFERGKLSKREYEVYKLKALAKITALGHKK